MSIIRKRELKKAGIKTRNQIRKSRKLLKNVPKCNKLYFINNLSFNYGLNPDFTIQSTKL